MTCFVRAEEQLQVATEDTYVTANGDPLAVDLTNIVGDDTVASVDSITPEPSDITLANPAPNASAFTDEGVTIAIGKGVLFDKSGGTADVEYTVRLVVTLSSGSKRGAEFKIAVE